ncbi:type I restriction endonuclease [Celeribacter persicus]|uniref:type I site-specific deoxyribonuclease n=1 Tax=Celeribacter persicus TaxID=1651082 RepID=A0A2T5HMH3_9RHOB|nr:type I restriction endonuclease [Celeribacter persicus]PTQ72756.1 type I restriction and modification enzyme subunit R-like protein [Celeribacter persicus]
MAWNSESDLEDWMMAKLASQGFVCDSGAEISPEKREPERRSFHDAILRKTFIKAVKRLNPDLPDGAVNEVVSTVTDEVLIGDPISENWRLHSLMVRGVPVTYFHQGEERNGRARLVDWTDEDNAWHAFNQVDMVGRTPRIPDVVIYLNGLPLVVVELKGTEGADIEAAFNQIETYKRDIPNLFRTTAFSVISDGINARYGTMSAGLDRFMRWRTVDGERVVPETEGLALGTLTEGLLNRRTLLDMLRWFIVFEDEGKGALKKAAGYHQFHAVHKAIDSILSARNDDGKGGVIWHTQGSGKSLLMAFLAGRVMHLPDLENPTLL